MQNKFRFDLQNQWFHNRRYVYFDFANYDIKVDILYADASENL